MLTCLSYLVSQFLWLWTQTQLTPACASRMTSQPCSTAAPHLVSLATQSASTWVQRCLARRAFAQVRTLGWWTPLTTRTGSLAWHTSQWSEMPRSQPDRRTAFGPCVCEMGCTWQWLPRPLFWHRAGIPDKLRSSLTGREAKCHSKTRRTGPPCTHSHKPLRRLSGHISTHSVNNLWGFYQSQQTLSEEFSILTQGSHPPDTFIFIIYWTVCLCLTVFFYTFHFKIKSLHDVFFFLSPKRFVLIKDFIINKSWKSFFSIYCCQMHLFLLRKKIKRKSMWRNLIHR